MSDVKLDPFDHDLVLDADGHPALIDGTEELRRSIVRRLKRPAWLTVEQYEETRRIAMAMGVQGQSRREVAFMPPHDWRSLSLDDPRPLDIHRITLLPTIVRGWGSRRAEAVMLPDWLEADDPEAQRWVPGTAAAEAVAAWCQGVVAACEWLRVERERHARMMLGLAVAFRRPTTLA